MRLDGPEATIGGCGIRSQRQGWDGGADGRRPGGGRFAAAFARVVIASGSALALSGCLGVVDPQGPVGRTNLAILLIALAVMLCIAVPVIVTALLFAWWFRKGNGRATRRPDFVYSGRIELVIWSIPLMVVLFLGGIAWVGSHLLDPYRPLKSEVAPLEVQVVALDWKWLFIYPQYGIASVNRLALPAGRPVHLSITSASVMNTFFVPQLGSMIYAMNGMTTQLSLQADQPGSYRGMSGHFSGDGFSDMHFETLSLPAATFEQWVAGARGKGVSLDASAYTELSRQSSAVAPFTYGAVAPALFEAVVDHRLAPGPGPTPGPENPNHDVSPRTKS